MSDLEQSLGWDADDEGATAGWDRRQRRRAAPRVLAPPRAAAGLRHSLDDSLDEWSLESPRVVAASAAPFAGPCRACRGDLELRPLRACVDCGRVLHRGCAVVGRCPACDIARQVRLPALGPGLVHGALGLAAGLASAACWLGAWPAAWPAAACLTLALSLAGVLASWKDDARAARLISWAGLLLVWPPLALGVVAALVVRGLFAWSADEVRLLLRAWRSGP